MKVYLDENGDIVEKPENLMEHLKQKAPELAERLDGLWAWKANLNAYRHFLYSFPCDEETKSEEKRGPKWEEYIKAIDSQQGLENALSDIEDLHNENMDIIDDTVVVVHSDRPFYDSLLVDGKKIGKAEGWVGIVESYDLTDVDDAKLFSYDGKIYKRFVLKNARRLTEKELREWAGANLMYAHHHHNVQGVRACLDRLGESSLGDERVVVYDKYPTIDHAVLKHELSEEEKQVAHISNEEARWINILPYYGKRQIDGSHFTLFRHFESDKNIYNTVFMAEDSRKISEIYEQVKAAVEERAEQQFAENPKLERVHIFVAKFVKDFITPEQRKKIKKVRYEDRNKWYKKLTDEQGLEITNKTMVGVLPWESGGVNKEAEQELIRIVEGILVPQGYEKIMYNIAYGLDDVCRGKLRAQTEYEFAWLPAPLLHAGELVILKNKNK